ncbi:MAG: MBOAT family protein, partial [Oscillospiraceae bacterium]|nr:MBOAT family protein [Oscillospiraceae bacterium]
VFYAFGGLTDVPLLIASALVHYAGGVRIEKKKTGRRLTLGVILTLDVAVLVLYKYWDFFMRSFGLPSALQLGLALPLGISFFTFQAMSYIIDVYRDGENGAKSFWQMLQYLSFFPQITSGPLMKFRDARVQIEKRTCDFKTVFDGVCRFVRGMAKKLLIAGAVGTVTDAVFALDASALDIRSAWLGAVCYAVQIFFDFSGYTDMAIGLGMLFGFRLPENFRAPYLASSITDFWRRWHISLSSWFRDYLYIPLGGNRRGKVRTVLNKWIVFLMTGLWHGANWTFLVWGMWHGLFISLETATPLKKAEKHWYGHIYALLASVLGFVIFRASSLTQALAMLGAMFAGFTMQAQTAALFASVSRYSLVMLAVGILAILPIASSLREKLSKFAWFDFAQFAWTLILFALCLMQIAAGAFVPFIYAQF